MRTIEEIRHARLLEILAQPEYPTVQALADKIGRSHAQVSQWKNRSKRTGGGLSNIDSASARLIEQATGKEIGWMDNEAAPERLSIAVRPEREGKPPAPDFDAVDITVSEWALLQDLRVYPEDRLAELREDAAKNREHFDRLWEAKKARELAAAKNKELKR